MSSAHGTPHTPLTPEQWSRLAPHVDAALGLEPADRPGYLDVACANDPALRADLERLLAECERGDSLIDRAAVERFALLLYDGIERLPAVLEDRFVVEREIGRGGMATVFLAHDRKHDRPVAIKVLRREVAASIGSNRFLREIRTAARLQHPSIMPLHDSGEADGFLYFIMPYARGESLRERLEREPQLPLDEVVRIARDVADALDHAHGNDIVHRDIKPENIFLSGSHAMVMDFGIARAVSPESDRTTHGFAVGTPAYMSPEQGAPGRRIDGRSDVYALGCVVYEMLTGHPPYLGTTAQEVIARHSLDSVPMLRASRPEVPETAERAVARALAKAPPDRFATATAFIEAFAGATTAPSRARNRSTAALVIFVLMIIAFAAWQQRSSSVQVAAVDQGEPSPSVAVLAFKSIGRDPGDEALSDGISEEIAATIGRIPGLAVKAPRSSFSLRDRNLTIQEIGQALNVRYLVDGTLQKDGNRLRVRVNLITARNDSTVWRGEYDRALGDVFAMQDDIAGSIAGELRIQLAPAAGNLARRATRSPEAHELYLRGRFFFQRRDSVSIRKAREYFAQAIATDSAYALAYAGLSDTYSHSSAFGYTTPHSSMPEARKYVNVALALDSTLVEAHSSRAFIATFYEWDWPLARREFQKAVALDPRYPSAHLWRGWYFMATDGIEEAIQSAETALSLEPFLPLTNTRLVTFLYFGRKYEQALQQAQKAFELDSTFFQIGVERARVLAELQRCGEAIQALSRAPRQTAAVLRGIHGYVYARCDRRSEAIAELNRLHDEAKAGKYVSHYSLAVIHAGLGNTDAALSALESAYDERAWTMFLLERDPAFDSLRNLPRFRRLARRVGLKSSS